MRITFLTKQVKYLHQHDAKNYLLIITNDSKISEQEVIVFYNKRGDSERVFDNQNKDFNWNSMPHSFLEENTVYLIIMAFAHIIYKYILTLFSEVVNGLSKTSRLKRLSIDLKKSFPRLPIMLLLDGLYPNKPVLDICRKNNWKYNIILKDNSLKSV